jgi:5-methylcytosine-specific restriction endonuclease McrA
MDYSKNYHDYIAYVKTLNRVKLSPTDPNFIYYEEHHILPRSLGGDNSPENLVLLTGREHYLAHFLLYKIYQGTSHEKPMACAFWFMQVKCPNSRLHEAARITLATYASERATTRVRTDKEIAERRQALSKSEWHKNRTKVPRKELAKRTAKRVRPVVCIETGEEFPSIKAAQAAGYYGLSRVIRTGGTSRGYHWCFKEIPDNMKKIRCLNDGKVYINLKEVTEILGVDGRWVRHTCQGKRAHVKGYQFEWV